MGRLFIFAIGGTGARVIKSLTFLLASGVKINAEEVIVILIDPHYYNEDLKRTLEIIDFYSGIYNKLNEAKGKSFFSTKLITLQDISENSKLSSSYLFKLKDVQGRKFREYFSYNTLDKKHKALINLLFSEKNLSTEMDIGFVGNPNIGAVVLNQFKDSDEFKIFSSHFKEDDRIFFISSIFGGTGAAGFPIILKNIRNAEQITSQEEEVKAKEFLKNAKIGAITVLPYFNIEPEKGAVIDHSTFIAKTKSALKYYAKNINKNKSLNALYYIGDKASKNFYKYDPGENGQKNNAHLIELISALAIIDFMRIPDDDLHTTEGKADKPIYKEFGLLEDRDIIHFEHFHHFTHKLLMPNMTKFFYFAKYLRDWFPKVIGGDNPQPYANQFSPKLEELSGSQFLDNWLRRFNQYYFEWLEEMVNNHRSFAPFNLKEMIGRDINGEKIKNVKMDYYTIDKFLNKIEKKKRAEFKTKEDKLILLFDYALTELLKSKFSAFKQLLK